jgi:hypothetical protein
MMHYPVMIRSPKQWSIADKTLITESSEIKAICTVQTEVGMIVAILTEDVSLYTIDERLKKRATITPQTREHLSLELTQMQLSLAGNNLTVFTFSAFWCFRFKIDL